MNEPTTGRPWRIVGALGLVAAAVALLLWTVAAQAHGWGPLAIDAGLASIIAVGALCTAGIGGLIAGKTGGPTGWLLGAGGVALAGALAGMRWLALDYGSPGAVRTPSSLHDAVWITAFALWWACVVQVVVFFPFGRLRPIRERGIGGRRLWIAPVLGWSGVAFMSAGAPRPGAIALALGSLAALAFASQRARSVSGSDRAQLVPVLGAAGAATLAFVATRTLGGSDVVTASEPLATVAWALAAIGIPAAVAVSIVRHRTFGIFRFVGYTADYRIWTAGLAVAALAAAAGLTVALTTVTGTDDLPIVVSTVALAVGACAWPWWRRAQTDVDERYGRRQADPARSLERFTDGIADADRPSLRAPIFDLLAGFAPAVIVQGEDDMRFALPTNDREVGRHTFVHGNYDLPTMRCAMELLANERGTDVNRVLAAGTVLDVGANIGTSLVPLMLQFAGSRGIAVEPAPDNLEFLRLNVALNGLTERVEILPIALSDHTGTVELELSPGNIGDHRVRVGPPIATDDLAARATIEVAVRSLDDLANAGTVDPARVTLAWLDVQGHEGHVLAGAQTLLARRVPVVSEFWPSTMEQVGGLRSFSTLVATHFARVIDLRRTQDEGKVVEVSPADLERLVERYAPSDSFTDLLLLP